MSEFGEVKSTPFDELLLEITTYRRCKLILRTISEIFSGVESRKKARRTGN
jgi:hypothetical protein